WARSGATMGKAILYCFKCSTLLREDDFAKGKAVRAGDRVACAGCAPEVPTPAPLSKKVTSTRIPAARPASSPAVHRPAIPPPEPAGRKILLIAGAAGVLLLLVVTGIVALRGQPAEPPPKPEPPVVDSTPRPAPEPPDRAALEAAR